MTTYLRVLDPPPPKEDVMQYRYVLPKKGKMIPVCFSAILVFILYFQE